MLSDEEKKAIDYFRNKIGDFELFYGKKITTEENEYLKIFLNLIEKQQKEIEELKDESKEYQIGFAQGCYEKDLDWEDKIKAKIEELEIEQESNREDLKIAIDNLLFQNIDKIGNKISINMSVRGILQSLLEKE